ncbi:MAG: UbiA family prenyltransferase, partial [Ilumatobacteraceae bacterium]
AGAAPPLLGWVAVTGHISAEPLLLVLIIFAWTPPHFWALAIRYADDYRAADVPMLPAVVPIAAAARQMLAYTAAMVVATLVLVPVADLGWIYTVAAVVLGAAFALATAALVRDPSPARSMKVFTASISYVTLLFGALTLDVLVVA